MTKLTRLLNGEMLEDALYNTKVGYIDVKVQENPNYDKDIELIEITFEDGSVLEITPNFDNLRRTEYMTAVLTTNVH